MVQRTRGTSPEVRHQSTTEGRNYAQRRNAVGNHESRSAEFGRSLTRNLNYSLRESVSTSRAFAPMWGRRGAPMGQTSRPITRSLWSYPSSPPPLPSPAAIMDNIFRLAILSAIYFTTSTSPRNRRKRRLKFHVTPICCTIYRTYIVHTTLYHVACKFIFMYLS